MFVIHDKGKSHCQTAPLIFLTGTVTDRMGCIPIMPVNVTFVPVTVTESLGVIEPLLKKHHTAQVLTWYLTLFEDFKNWLLDNIETGRILELQLG